MDRDDEDSLEEEGGGRRRVIIRFPTAEERELRRRERPAGPPLINLPPVTKVLTILLLGIHAAIYFVLTPEQQDWVFTHFGLVPGAYTAHATFSWTAVFAPLTYMLLHGGWAHVLLNTAMLMAFGAGVERWMGGRKMLVFSILCGLIAALVQCVVTPFSDAPVIGASGAESGLFAAVLVMMQQAGMSGRMGLWPFIVLWVIMSAGFGITGGPGGEAIAWQAHIGGFLAGLGLIGPFLKARL